MTFAQHVLELRRRLLVFLGSVLVFAVAGYFAFPYFFDFVSSILSEDLYVTKVYEGFITRFKIALILGVFLSIPLLLYQVMAYILPALTKKEKIAIGSILIASFLLFCGGIFFSIRFVLPISVTFLKSTSFFPGNLNRIISYDSFILFFFQFILAFGLCLQFPVVLLILMHYQVITRRTLLRFFKYFVALALLVAGIMTPPDVVSQLMLPGPLIVLYLLSILIAKILRWG